MRISDWSSDVCSSDLKALIESRPMPDRVPDPSLIVDNGPRYDRVLASRGKGYAFAYSYSGRPFTLRLGAISGRQVRAAWYSPRDAAVTRIGTFPNRGRPRFPPPRHTPPRHAPPPRRKNAGGGKG